MSTTSASKRSALRCAAIALVAAMAAPAVAETVARIRTDGLYVNEIPSSAGQRRFAYLHFYSSGDIAYLTTTRQVADVAKSWIELLGAGRLGFGRHTTSGDRLEIVDGFMHSSSNPKYSGILSSKGLVLERTGDLEHWSPLDNPRGLWAPGEYAHVALALPAGGVRFDGVYGCGGPMGFQGELLRFWPDGKVAAFPGNMNTQQRKIFEPRTRLPKGLYKQKGVYAISGQELTLSIWGESFRGFFVGEDFRLDRECPGQGKLVTQSYRFESVPGVDPGRREPWARVTLGHAVLDATCKSVQFEAIPPAVALRAGTMEIGYRIELSAEGAQARATTSARVPAAACGGGFDATTCNEFVIVEGQPTVLSQTTTLRCKDGGAIRPGRYELEALLGDEPEHAVAFEVR